MNCQRSRQWLPLAAGGDLPPLNRWLLNRHLKHCGPCRQALTQIETVNALAAKALAAKALAADPTHGPSLAEAVLFGLPPAGGRIIKKTTGRRSWRFALPAMAAAAALTLLMVHRQPARLPEGCHDLPVVVDAPENTTVMTFKTDDPKITVVWFFQNDQPNELGGS